MKPRFFRLAGRSCLFASVLVTAATSASAQTTGWNQTAAGTYDFNNTGNWVGGAINGIWDPSLTLAGAQTLTFGSDTTLTTGLNFSYDGAQNLTLRSDGSANRTLTLGGNIIVDTVSANRTITLGSTTANQGLNVDLGGSTRTFSVGGIAGTNSTRTLTFANNVTNGGLILNGGGIVNLNGNTNTLSSLRIRNNAFRITGNSGADTSTSISGALTIDGAATSVPGNLDQLGGIATITLTPNASHNTALTASSLVRENKGVALFRGNTLGGTLGANGVANINFTTAPDLIGGGGVAGSTNISIIGWAVGATTATSNANTFVTYDAINGIRPLNTTTEFENYSSGYTGAVTGATNSNTRVATGTVTFTGDNTVNSLFLGESGTTTLAGDGGTLTVTSGAVFLNSGSSTISANLNFGTREGVIGYIQGQNTTISGGIAGSGGLTVYQAQSNTSSFSPGTGTQFTGAATFTGDFTVNSRAQINHSDFLPYGSRSGNVVVNGLLTLNGQGTDSRGYTMNGLFGNGRLNKGSSGAGLFRIGDNNSDGNFSGVIADGGTTALEKIGGGTQIFTGANSWAGVTRVLGGTLDVSLLADGLQNSGIGRSSNAATNLVLNGGTLKYSGVATSTDRLFTVGTSGGGLDSSGSGAVTLNNAGNNITAEPASRVGTRTTGSNIVTGVTNFADLVVGARVSGTGITAGTTITAINTTTGEITLSANATVNSSTNMSFSTDRTLSLTGSNTGDNTISGVLANSSASGILSVSKSGAGTWVVSGNNTYTGPTNVTAGTLVVNGSLGNTTTTIGSNGTLKGAGSIAGATSVLGTLAPGNSIGTLGFGSSLDLLGISNFEIDPTLGLGLNADLADVTGALTYGGTLNVLYGGSSSNFANGMVFNLFDAGSFAGSFSSINLPDLTGTGLSWQDNLLSNGTLVVVPEPRAALLGGLGMLALLRRRRG